MVLDVNNVPYVWVSCDDLGNASDGIRIGPDEVGVIERIARGSSHGQQRSETVERCRLEVRKVCACVVRNIRGEGRIAT